MAKNLLIVESPSKAKTIEKYLGRDFTVKSSYGHIRDLEKGDKGIDIENDFEPSYVVSAEKAKVVKELKTWTKKVDEVWLATDEDREGEAISWHLCEVLNLDPESTKRIVFREITEAAIRGAIQKPRTVDVNLVNAQQARRILDRLVGFELSSLLWRKIKGQLSAGRVQSVAVKLLVEREREIQAFESQSAYKVEGTFSGTAPGREEKFKAFAKKKFHTKEEAHKYLEDCAKATFRISDVVVRPTRRKSAAPFTTSTLQQDASRKLGFAVKRTMQVAQRLYEQGYISYMRTDSTTLSQTAIKGISEVITSQYGDEYLQVRQHRTAKKDAQEAHEAIRPTNFALSDLAASERDMRRLYSLIWKRAVASQMADAEIEKTSVQIDVSTRPDEGFEAKGEVITFDGFLKLYVESKDEEDDSQSNRLPKLNKGDALARLQVKATQRFSRPPARYTEAGLVKQLEKLGIGRPSTYAPTITKIMEEKRGYVNKEERPGQERAYVVLTLQESKITEATLTEMTGAVKNRLIPTDLGMLVCDFLDEHFEEIMNYNFTADIEQKFDQIAGGNGHWKKMIAEFYFPFHKEVTKVLEEADRATGERVLGEDPETGRTVLVRMSRLGRPVVQIGKPEELEEGEKPKYANLRPHQMMKDIDLTEALKLHELPKYFEGYKGKEVMVNTGRYGPYVKWGEDFISLPRGVDPYEVGRAELLEVIDAKIKEDEPLLMYKGLPVTKGKGRFGPYLKWNNLYANVGKKYDFDNLTAEEVLFLVQAKEEKEANRYIHRWPEEGIDVENGRWGPFIRFKKKSIKIPRPEKGVKVTSEMAKELTLEEVKSIIETELPGTFTKKKKTSKTTRKSKAKK